MRVCSSTLFGTSPALGKIALKTNKSNPPTRVCEAAIPRKPEGKYILRLYVAGATVRSRQALRRVYQLCEAELKGNYDLTVVDVYQQAELAQDNQIVATPTLIKEFPWPVRRFIGNLANLTRLFGEPEVASRKIAPALERSPHRMRDVPVGG
jgi:circadian clock protein KaiB